MNLAIVIPAKAGIQFADLLDSRLRGNDKLVDANQIPLIIQST